MLLIKFPSSFKEEMVYEQVCKWVTDLDVSNFTHTSIVCDVVLSG